MLVKAQFNFGDHVDNMEWHNNVHLSVMDDNHKISGVYSKQIIAKIKSDSLCHSEFTNTGDALVVISKAQGSFGCAVPTYTKDVILPGETVGINVKYATDRIGRFTKTVTLTSNASESSKVLRIKGEVLKPESKG